MKLENLVVTKFDTSSDDLVENLPYIIENIETKERQIGTLRSSECDTLAFGTWKGSITITPADAGKYNIYKANLTDGMYLLFKNDTLSISASHDMSEEKMKQIKDAMSEEGVVQMALFNQRFNNVSVLDVNDRPQQISTIACLRGIDYNNNTDDAITTGIEYFYTVLAHVTIIRQFLYKVTREKDNIKNQILYEIMLPASESEKKDYMDKGWKIHPMFYNKENDCYMPTVRIQRPMQLMTFPNCNKDDSITIQILSGLQLLHLIEHGLNEKDKEEPGMYAGIDYTNNGIIISNAYTDENNWLFINNERTGVAIQSNCGYISRRFMYWNDDNDWMFFPKETTKDVNKGISDSVFTGPSMGVNNIVKWGSNESENFGIFSYWMRSTEASENDYIIPWEFGGY